MLGLVSYDDNDSLMVSWQYEEEKHQRPNIKEMKTILQSIVDDVSREEIGRLEVVDCPTLTLISHLLIFLFVRDRQAGG